jgi:hypothetical protein
LKETLTEVGGFSLTEITVKVSTMRLLETSTEAKIRELDVSSGIQEQVVWLNVPTYITKVILFNDVTSINDMISQRIRYARIIPQHQK